MKSRIQRVVCWLAFNGLCALTVFTQELELPFELPTDPDRWKEEDFEKRFKGSYGINAYLEPELDVDNFNVYEGVLAFLENREGAITYIKNAMVTLQDQGVEVSGSLHFLLGNFYFEKGDHDLASGEYIKAVHKHPNFLRAYENLGYSLMQLNKNEEALPVLLKALELGSNDSQIHGLIGFLYLEKELYLSSLTAFEWAMLFNPRNNTWRLGVLQSLINLSRIEDALGVAEEILSFDPDNSGNWLNIANLLLRLEKQDEGISHLEVAHQMGGATYESRRLLGNLYFNRKMFVAAIREFRVLLNQVTEAEQLEDLLEVCEGLVYFGHLEDAQALLSHLTDKGAKLELKLNQVSLNFIQAVIHIESERYVEAERLLLQVMEMDPTHARALLMLAEAHISQNELDEAGVYYELAQMYPQVSYDAFYRHAQLLLAQDRIEEALGKLRQAQSIEGSEELAEVIRSIEETGRLLR